MAYCGGMTIHNSLTAHIVNIHKAGIWQPGLARFSNDCVLGYYARLRCDQFCTIVQKFGGRPWDISVENSGCLEMGSAGMSRTPEIQIGFFA
jgi:hypothetical protein